MKILYSGYLSIVQSEATSPQVGCIAQITCSTAVSTHTTSSQNPITQASSSDSDTSVQCSQSLEETTVQAEN